MNALGQIEYIRHIEDMLTRIETQSETLRAQITALIKGSVTPYAPPWSMLSSRLMAART